MRSQKLSGNELALFRTKLKAASDAVSSSPEDPDREEAKALLRRLERSAPYAILKERVAKLGGRIILIASRHSDFAFGRISEDGGVIAVYLRRPDGELWGVADILFIVAHELRHAEHKALGLYRDYYERRREATPRRFLVALSAERDCDRHAARFLKDYLPGEKSMLTKRKYPAWRIASEFLPDAIRYHRWLVMQAFKKMGPDRPTGLEPDLFG